MPLGEVRLWLYRQVGQITVTPPHVDRRDADDGRRLGDLLQRVRHWLHRNTKRQAKRNIHGSTKR